MLRVGVTGNSGAGKSVISKMIADKGIPLYDVDVKCKELIHSCPGLRAAIIDFFGASAYFEDGSYNSKYVANIVFNDPEQKKILESEVGRYMMKDYQDWVEQIDKTRSCEFLLVDCAYFYELEIEHMVDIMVGVKAPLPIRIERIMKRDGITVEQVNDRLKNQMDQEEKMANCHFVFDAGDEFINTKKLNELLVPLSVFGHKFGSTERRLKKLVATGIAYGMGVGSTMDRTEIPVELMVSPGWELMDKVSKAKSIRSEQQMEKEKQLVMSTIDKFFKDNAI